MKPEVISKLKANLRGGVVLPEDQDYNEARKVYNGMIDKHPKMIVKCANAADVRLAVAFARENDLIVAVRGGGHNGAGLATCDDGMVIDLSQMKGVRFDPSDPFPAHLHHKNLCGIIWCYSGPPEGADAAFKPVREFRKPLLEVIS